MHKKKKIHGIALAKGFVYEPELALDLTFKDEVVFK